MGAWGLKMRDGSWVIIDITDRKLFEDSKLTVKDGHRYFSRVRRIVLATLPAESIARAVKNCGFHRDQNGITRVSPLEEYIPGVKFIGTKVAPEYEETVVVDCCVQYGLGEVVWDYELDDADRLRELAKREAYKLIRNAESMTSPEDVKEFNELLKKHSKSPMFPLSNILPSTRAASKPKSVN
jgi:hypothetical protein